MGAGAGFGAGLQMVGVLVDSTLPGKGGGASGVFGYQHAKLDLLGCRVVANIDYGLGIAGPSSALIATGVAVGLHQPSALGTDGHGVAVTDGAALSLAASFVYGNHATGMTVQSASADVRDSVLVATAPADSSLGTKLPVADGLTGLNPVNLLIVNSLFAKNYRAGIAVKGSGNVTLQGVIGAQNAFGLVLDANAVAKATNVVFFGNSVQNQAGGLGLPVPPPPNLVPLSGVTTPNVKVP